MIQLLTNFLLIKQKESRTKNHKPICIKNKPEEEGIRISKLKFKELNQWLSIIIPKINNN